LEATERLQKHLMSKPKTSVVMPIIIAPKTVLNDQPKTTLGTQFGHGELFNRGKLLIIGGADGSRTHDLLNAIQALSQLSYGPTIGRTE
jgi:hypothetical protein